MRPLLAASVVPFVLLAPPIAGAEPVAPAGDDASLAATPGGSPRVVVSRGATATAYARAPGGSWAPIGTLALPGGSAAVVGAAATRGSTIALLEDGGGAWLALATFARSPRLQVLARAAPGGQLGVAGLVLDQRSRPAVAWAALAPSGDTSLQLWRRGRTAAITRNGFPASDVAPPADPVVMADGSVRVVESYGVPRESATIEWRRSGRTWTGQYIFASALGLPTGFLRAARTGPAVYAAWTHVYDTLGQANVVVATHARGRESSRTVLTHATLVELVSAGPAYELAANDWIPSDAFDVADGEAVDAALVATPRGRTTELDGAILGYAARGRTRQFLLERDRQLEWYRSPRPPAAAVSATAVRSGAIATVTGRVSGAASGVVRVYRERPGTPRVLAATAPLAADGSFSASDTPPTLPVTYRAVWTDPATGLPYASLVRPPLR